MPSSKPSAGGYHRVTSHHTRTDSLLLRMKAENEEEEEAASHQGSQHSEELPEVADILEKAAPR